MHPFPHNIGLKFSIDLDPWPHHPLIFSQTPLKAVPSHLYHLQITVKSVHILIFGLKYCPITCENAFENLK